MEIDRASFGRAADRALLTRESPVKLRLGESPRMYKLKVYQTEERIEIAGTREALKLILIKQILSPAILSISGSNKKKGAHGERLFAFIVADQAISRSRSFSMSRFSLSVSRSTSCLVSRAASFTLPQAFCTLPFTSSAPPST